MTDAKSKSIKGFNSWLPSSLTWTKLAWLTLLILMMSFILPHFGQIGQEGDADVYQSYSYAMWHGAMPYRDFTLEYPPGSLLVIAAAQPVARLLGNYAVGFSLLAAVVVFFLLKYLHSLRDDKTMWVFVLLITPMLGLVFFGLEIFSAAALFASLVAVRRQRFIWSATLLATAVLIKGYPIVGLPALLLYIPREKVKTYLGTMGTVLVLGILPFVALSPSGTWSAVQYHLSRPIEIGSAQAGVGFVLHWFGEPLKVVRAYKSFGVDFPAAGAVVAIFLGLQAAAMLSLVVWISRLGNHSQLALEFTVFLLGFILFFKVGSPQYLIPVILVSLAARQELSEKDRLGLAVRLFLLAGLVFVTLMVFLRLVALQWPAELLVISRYVLIFELGIWILKRIKYSQPAKATSSAT